MQIQYDNEIHASGYPLLHPRLTYHVAVRVGNATDPLTPKLFRISNALSSISLTLPCSRQMAGKIFYVNSQSNCDK